MSTAIQSEKPKVLCLMQPKAAGKAYMEAFESKFHIDVLRAKNRAEAIPAISQAVTETGPYFAFVILQGTAPFEDFDSEFLQALVPSCRIIVSASAGYNEFDVDWMSANGMWFCNTRDSTSEPTADMAMFLILAAVRDTTRAENSARSGLWRNDHVPCSDPSEMNLGIVGMGTIGKYLAKKAVAFNMNVYYYNRTRLAPDVEGKFNATYCSSLEELLQVSDVVSINCPQNAATIGLIGAKEFSQMKDGAFFINTARGPIVDEEALIAALESGKITRAGLDVFATEPALNPYFMKSDRCIIQPHLGGLTTRARKNGEIECFENIRALYETGRPVAPVNEILG